MLAHTFILFLLKNVGGSKKVAPVADADKKTKQFETHDFSKGSGGGATHHKHHAPKPKKESRDDHIGDDLLALLNAEKKKKKHQKRHSA